MVFCAATAAAVPQTVPNMTSQVANADITARKKKLEKKLLKLRDLGDAADAGAVAKLARKLAKLTKTAVADTSSTPGSGQSEDSMLVLPVGADASNPGKVKSKKRASDTNGAAPVLLSVSHACMQMLPLTPHPLSPHPPHTHLPPVLHMHAHVAGLRVP